MCYSASKPYIHITIALNKIHKFSCISKDVNPHTKGNGIWRWLVPLVQNGISTIPAAPPRGCPRNASQWTVTTCKGKEVLANVAFTGGGCVAYHQVWFKSTKTRSHITVEIWKRNFISSVNLPSIPIRHKDGAFRERSSNQRNLKTTALRFNVDETHFENRVFTKTMTSQ